MLELLCDNPEIHDFLDQFPKYQWRKCIEASVVVGINRIKEKHSVVTYETVLQEAGFHDKKKKDIEEALVNMKKDILRISSKVDNLESRPKTNEKLNEIILQQNSEDVGWKSKQNLKLGNQDTNCMDPSRSSSRSKQNISGIQQNATSTAAMKISHHQHNNETKAQKKSKLPKYLASPNSGLKGEFQKDELLYNSKGEIESLTEPQELTWESPTKKLREIKGNQLQKPSSQYRCGSLSSFSFSLDLKEPETCPIEQLQNYVSSKNLPKAEKIPILKNKPQESTMLKIADDFLKNPFTSFLAKESSTVPVSPQGFTSALSSPSNRFRIPNKEEMQYRY
ncbi:unnamed protein product [Blepharisma stoltei]|uniref:Uncharacterized protein n=1 Tax=Blepharisma stoltei TaxID=1481888 RepID=A0AAU9JUM9_9CILI|nr:unnamed protein product [Blepharisma stoltei]